MESHHEKFIIDATGNKTEVILPYKEWQKILELLEDLKDIHDYDEAKAQPSNPVSWNDALRQLKKS